MANNLSKDPTSWSAEGAVATVVLSSPANRNALTVELLASLSESLDAAVGSGARALVLAAQGPAFCAGLDLGETDPARLKRATSLLVAVMRQLLSLPLPVIARVHGPVRAGGLGLVAAADAAVAADDVSFAFTEARLGLAPAVVSLCVLPRLRHRDASRLFLSGEVVSAARAADLGLIDEAVRGDELDTRIGELLSPLLAADPQGMAATKALVAAAMVRDLDERGEDMAALSARLFASPAARDAIAAARHR